MSKKISTRVAYGEALAALGASKEIVVLDADLSICTMTEFFKAEYPERFFNIGIAESNMMGVAAGFATCGKTVFANSFAMFAAGRAYEQIRNSIAYPNLNVTVVGTHAGLSVGKDGATHQCLEDLSLMRTIPGMTVLCPADSFETKRAVSWLVSHKGPAYLRLSRMPVEEVCEHVSFRVGEASLMHPGEDACIIACGIMVQRALLAAKELEKAGIHVRVLNMSTIKPIDEESIVKAALETGCIVTVEEHNIIGGLGSAVSEVLAEQCPTPLYRIGVKDVFGKSGNEEALLEKYGLTTEAIVLKVKELYLDKERKSAQKEIALAGK